MPLMATELERGARTGAVLGGNRTGAVLGGKRPGGGSIGADSVRSAEIFFSYVHNRNEHGAL